MPWYCDMSCSAVRSGRAPGHEPHFSVAFPALRPPIPEGLASDDPRDRKVAIADQWDDLSDKLRLLENIWKPSG